MTDRTDQQLKTLLEEAANGVGEQPGDLKGKVGAFYASFMDEADDRTPRRRRHRARARRHPHGARTLPPLAPADGRERVGLLRRRRSAPSIDVDLKNPNVYAIYLSQGGLGLPDRDYYLKDSFAGAAAKPIAPMPQQLLTLIGWPDPAGARRRR